jgi:hypothetical protein
MKKVREEKGVCLSCAALALEGVDNVHCRDSLAASVLGVGDRVTDDIPWSSKVERNLIERLD